MILGLLIVIGICSVVLVMTRDRDDPRDRHPSTGGALLPDPPLHVRLVDLDDEL